MSGALYSPAVDYFKENVVDYDIFQGETDTWSLICYIIVIIVMAVALLVAICGAKEASGWKKKMSSPVACLAMVVVTFLAAYLIRSKFHIIDTAEEYKKCDFFYDENEYYGKIACGFIPDPYYETIYYKPKVDKYCRDFLPKLDEANLITRAGAMATQIGTMMVLVAASLNLAISRFEDHHSPEDVGNRRY
ncbi:hypothetical protein RUM43_012403 [Polyplax serrata]|uniref:Uncharacterized protein n=1 Tax=Polyplax serrata TaxID=468196 RepID=A0AAN8S7F9_POLSC